MPKSSLLAAELASVSNRSPRPRAKHMMPVVALDVDGVLSPLGPPSRAWSDWRDAPGAGFALPLSAAMAARLAALPARRVWLTSWEHSANTTVAPALDWAPLEVLESGGRAATARIRWWKLRALLAWLATQPALPGLVWIDDDLIHHPSARRHLDDVGVPYLLVSPQRSTGLSSPQLRRIETFVAHHS